MNEVLQLGLYSACILAGVLGAAAVPLWRPHPRRTDLFLSLSAGIMLGAAFFHMLPEAVEQAGADVTGAVVLGFLFLFLLERMVLIHACEGPDCEAHSLSLAAFIGLSLHTVTDGLALGAAMGPAGLGPFVFFAILVHMLPSSFSLASILQAGGHYSRARIVAMNGALALMVPLGVLVYWGLGHLVDGARATPFTLAFSAGTFLHIALSDLLPDLHRRKVMKGPLTATLLAGLGGMYALAHVPLLR